MIRLDSGLLIAVYRDAYFDAPDTPDEAGEHGLKGDIYMTKSNNGMTWNGPRLLYDHRITGENEQHSILSKVGKRCFIVSRQFGDSYRVYVAEYIEGTMEITERRLISSPEEYRFWTVYGHIIQVDGDVLLMPVYGIPSFAWEDSRVLASGVMRSMDHGVSWEFLSFIGKRDDISFNETAIISLNKGRLLAIIRTDDRERLYRSISEDNGKSWSEPYYTGIRGEAPSLLRIGEERLLMLYRGFGNDEIYDIRLSLSLNEGNTWTEGYPISVYRGSKYDGGYGDLALIGKDTVVVIFYTSDKDRQTWIASVRIRINPCF